MGWVELFGRWLTHELGHGERVGSAKSVLQYGVRCRVQWSGVRRQMEHLSVRICRYGWVLGFGGLREL